MLRCLCGPPSIPLSFNLAAVLPRRNTYCVCSGTGGVDTPYTWYSSFTAWTTRVSNPVCSPRFRASASVTVQKAAFATGVPPNIYAFHRYTRNSAFLSRTQVPQYWMHCPGWAREFHTQLKVPPTHPLRPVIPDNARRLRITAAAGT